MACREKMNRVLKSQPVCFRQNQKRPVSKHLQSTYLLLFSYCLVSIDKHSKTPE
jgi:hypothetical protein